MVRYTIQRIVYMIITLLIIATATFFLMKLLPGSPLQNTERLSPEQQQIILDKYGLNDPLPEQYINYMVGLAKGDLGLSFQYDNRPVTQILGSRIGPSSLLGFQAMVLGTFIGLLVGIIAAIKHNTWLDYGSTFMAVLGISIPSFVFAALLQYYVGVKLEWLPVALWGEYKHTILPTLALTVGVVATIARFMRTEMLEILNSDYILLATAKGISKTGTIVKHGVRNAMIPIVTILGPMTVAVMTGSLVVERIFAVPGLGEQFVLSINTNDYTVIMGITLFFSALFIGVIFLVDILYGIIDPRIRLAGGKK
ncbi:MULTISPECIES: oligopeptide ABC transporter permease [Rossellomorea]|uniref:ABC transporter permease subunit n=1 Tax=Rossellomorea vietnamensis TaxID=218284 RepID=A0A0P6WIW5_9BACI|nr:oligopeptide ABC transporter permease [Rossellomorea vietnamensis]OXS54588.1 peptide ABC transporter permease [Bacillus sp. DSM 27956]PRX65820.1 oligopeptide transport system permease protein [Bacillus sp. V-88]KPL61419.1 peptide ABC transporter permease [Rossellomorea vietnamensis]QHE60996.1 ABC transporter permease subunit [Rossellomorea vietnamensis]SLK24875.1 oligopeptide transport system permease protein [Bacillus sp. V-88]